MVKRGNKIYVKEPWRLKSLPWRTLGFSEYGLVNASIASLPLRTLTHPSGISVIGVVLHIKSMETKSVCGCHVQILWLLLTSTFLAETVIQMQDPWFIVDRTLLNTKWMLPNSTIVLSMWFIIRSNSFTVWDISFILQKLLHSSMIPGVSSLNLHEYGIHGRC